MKNIIDNILYTTIIVYVLIMCGIVILKPQSMYDDSQKHFKQFGIDNGKTIFALPIIGIVMCILSYIFVMMYYLVILKVK
jgi:hypothetical protein